MVFPTVDCLTTVTSSLPNAAVSLWSIFSNDPLVPEAYKFDLADPAIESIFIM